MPVHKWVAHSVHFAVCITVIGNSAAPPKDAKTYMPTFTHKNVLAAPVGRHQVTGTKGLYLLVAQAKDGTTSRRFVFRYTSPARPGKVTETKVGTFPAMGLADATAKAAELRALVSKGTDPNLQRREEIPAKAINEATFAQVAERYITAMAPTWRTATYPQGLRYLLHSHAKGLAALPVATISAADMVSVLDPVFKQSNKLGRRTLKAIEAVLNFAFAQELRKDLSPPGSAS